ncbi:Serine/threonine protein kinase, partial [Giardia duodenalis]
VDDFRESWARAAKELRRAVQNLHLAIPLHGGEIRRLEDVRKTVIGLSKPIAEITQIITRNIAISREHQRELESLDGSERDLEMRRTVKILEYHSGEFDQPCTVCMQCAKYVQIEGINCADYAMACHEGCYLDNAVPVALGDPNLPSCSSTSGSVCTPTTRRAPERSSSTIPEPRRGSETLGIERARLSRLSQSTEMGEQYEAEQRRIIEIGARFALFVEKNAILGFNASLGAYLKAQIESLQNKIPPGPPEPHEHILQSLENFRRSLDSYNEERRIFQEAISNGDSAVPTAGEVEAMIHELEGLPLTGRGFQEALRDICHHANCAGGPRDV